MAVILRNGIHSWKEGILPFRINNSGFTKKALKEINRAINHWNSNTNWQIIERTRERNYVEFQVGEQCSSKVGRQGGRQFINLKNTCKFGSIVHEIGHAIGFTHEHKRGDRDNFVVVMKDRIDPEQYSVNFAKVSQELYFDHGEYDYNSIMHYGKRFFLKTQRYNWSSDWTSSEFYTIDGNTYLFLLKCVNGLVHVHKMGDDFVGREIERHDWANGFTNVRFYEINNQTFMFHLKSGDGVFHIHEMNNNGTVGRRLQSRNWSDGWTTSEFYTINGITFLFLLKSRNGIVHIHRVNESGTVGAEIRRYDWSNGFTNVKFYKVGDQQFIFRLKSGNGTMHVNSMNDDGTVGVQLERKNWTNGWTTSEFYSINDKTYLFLLKASTGLVHIHRMNNDGTVGTQIQSFDWSSEWTDVRFYQTGTGTFLWALKTSSGTVHIHHMNQNGTLGNEIKVTPKINIYAPLTIGQRVGLSPGDIAAANDRI